MTRYEYSGDRDKGIEWAERDETMDRRSTSRNTIASASCRIVCFALISAPSSLDSFPRVLSFPKITSVPSLLFLLSVSSLFPNLAAGGILLVINLAKVTLITAEFYLSRLASTSQSRTPANFSSSFPPSIRFIIQKKNFKRDKRIIHRIIHSTKKSRVDLYYRCINTHARHHI